MPYIFSHVTCILDRVQVRTSTTMCIGIPCTGDSNWPPAMNVQQAWAHIWPHTVRVGLIRDSSRRNNSFLAGTPTNDNSKSCQLKPAQRSPPALWTAFPVLGLDAPCFRMARLLLQSCHSITLQSVQVQADRTYT
jgi:hypothetical protein